MFWKSRRKGLCHLLYNDIPVIFIVYNAVIMMVICGYEIKGALNLLFVIPTFYVFANEPILFRLRTVF